MNILKIILRFCLILFLNVAHANNSSDKLSITVIPPTPSKLALLAHSYEVYLDGVIDHDAPYRLYEAVEKIPSNYFIEFYLNSPGGDLYAGLMMGRIIRGVKGVTAIGKQPEEKDYLFANNVTKPGQCASACTFAYLGGEYRFYKEGSEYGVHQFYVVDETAIKDPISRAQITTARLAAYLKEMGVDSDLLSYMIEADKYNLKMLSEEEMYKLKIVNNGRAQSQWTIEVLRGFKEGYYLKGQQEMSNGSAKAIFLCNISNDIVLQSIYKPTQRSDDEIKKIIEEEWPASLLFWPDGKIERLPVKEVSFLPYEDSTLMTAQKLSTQQVNKIIENKYFEYIVQKPENLKVYMGYRIDMNEEDLIKVEAFFHNCLKEDTSSKTSDRPKSKTPTDSYLKEDSSNPVIATAVRRNKASNDASMKGCMTNKLEIFSRRLLNQGKQYSEEEYKNIIEQATNSTVKSCQKEFDAIYNGPSFDCTKELGVTEQAICSNSYLSAVDVMFDNAVRAAKAMNSKSIQEQITNELRSWIKKRNKCGFNEDCIERIYFDQLERIFAY